MEAREWLMLGIVIVGPLLIAVIVTLWTLEQAIKRNARNRGGKNVRRVAVAADDVGAAAGVGAVSERPSGGGVHGAVDDVGGPSHGSPDGGSTGGAGDAD